MARINPVKVKQDADKLEKAGKFDQALALFRQVVEDNPRDWNTLKKVGDLYVRLNKNREAAEEYAKVADFYAKDGFLLKAIAIWKQINKLDASSLDPYLNLADLYAKQGLMMEAKSQYQIVVDEYIKRGKMRDAGDVLKKMADIDPGDLKVRSKLADLYTREGNSGKAVDEHIAIADELTKKGHLAEALQVLEKGLKLDPKVNRLRLELARILLVQKNHERAAHYLEEAVQQNPSDTQTLAKLGEAYLGGKKIEEAEAIFKRLLELDPQDQESRVQMARVYLLQKQFDKAHNEFLPVVEKLLERKEGDKAAALLQQLVQANPGHVKSLLKLVEIYRQLQKDNYVVSTYSQLTEAYINQGRMDQAAGVLEILVSMEPQNQQHKTKLQFVRGKQKGAPTAPPPAAPAPASASDLEEEEFDLTATDEAPAFAGFEEEDAAAAPAPARPAIEVTGPLSDEDKEFIEEHLAEGRVFRKYGLVDKAADQFDAVIARFADNVDARQELRDVLKEKGQNTKAAEQSLAIAEVFRLRGDAAQAAVHEEEAERLAPGSVAAAAPPPPAKAAPKPSAPKAAPAPKPAAAPKPPPKPEPVEVEEEIPLGEAEEEIPLEVEEGGLEGSLDLSTESAGELPGLDLGEEAAGDELPARFVEEEEPRQEGPVGDLDLAMGLGTEDLDLGEPEPPPPPPPPAPLKAVAPKAAAKAAPRPAPKPAPAPAAVAPVRKAPPPPPAPSGLPAELQRVLDEVDSYISLGFVDDAKDALREIGARYPGHLAILEKIGELGLDQEVVEEAPATAAAAQAGDLDLDLDEPPAPPVAAEEEEASPFGDALGDLSLPEPPPPEPSLPEPEFPEPAFAEPPGPAQEEGGIDLGAELGELFGAQSAVEEAPAESASTDLGDAGLADIFKEFKKGVDKQLGKEDYDTRYNLGIAYKEMGLIDEAIAEFQLAAKDENRLLECSSMLGICFMDKGMPKLAVKWFEKGLKAPGRSEEEYQGLRYDLAMAYEAAGEIDRAFGIFTDLYGQDANFRDVATKVRELKAALG